MKPSTRPHCYICGATDNLTADHLPPRGFFPPSSEQNLITAPLCQTCHRPLTKTDEAMRVWLAASAGTSDAGKWIWKNKVLASTFPRSPKLLAHIREKHFQPIITPDGEVVAGVFTMPQARAIPFIRRLTKGFLYVLRPSYDYFSDFFGVAYARRTPESVQVVMELASKLPQVSIGNGVLRVWHGLTAETADAGVCVFLFYDAVCFLCFFGRQETFRQKSEDGYEEEIGLPPGL